MYLPKRLGQCRTVLGQRARSRQRDGRPPRIHLVIPPLNDPLRHRSRLFAKVGDKVALDARLDLRFGPIVQHAHLVRLEESEQRAVGAVRGRDVERGARRPAIADGLARQIEGAPKGRGVDGDGLAERAHEHALRQLVALRGEGGVVGDAGRERRRHGDDDVLRYDGVVVVRRDGVACGAAGYGSDGGIEDDGVAAESVGEARGQEARAADDAALLGAAGDGEKTFEGARGGLVAGGGDVGEDVEEGELGGLGGEDGGGGGFDEGGGGFRGGHVGEEGLQRHGVPYGRVRVGPGRVDVDGCRHRVQLGDQRCELHERGIIQRRDDAIVRVRRALTLRDEDVVAVVVFGEGL